MKLRVLFIFGILGLMTGCGASRTTTLPEVWRQSVESTDHLDVTEDDAYILGAEEKRVVAHDAESGSHRWTVKEEKSLFSRFMRSGTYEVGGVEISPADYDADRYATVVLEDDQTVIVLDYTLNTDHITAVDLTTGDELWSSEDFSYSLARYDAAADLLMQTADVRQVGSGTLRAQRIDRTPSFMEDLIRPVPELGGFLFKTRDGLSLIESRSGEVRWTARSIDGLGLATAEFLPERDELIIVNFAPRRTFEQQIARIDARTGDVVWVEPYTARFHRSSLFDAPQIHVQDGLLVLESIGLEVYDYESGDKLWQSHSSEFMEEQNWVSPWSFVYAPPVVVDGVAYLVDSASKSGPDCYGDCAIVARKYDLRTGDVLWEAGPWERMVRVPTVEIVDDVLVVALHSELWARYPGRITGLDTQTGETRWQSEGLDVELFDIVADGAAVFAAAKGRVQRIDGRTGTVEFDVAYDDATAGTTTGTIADAGDHLIAAGSDGIAAYSKSDGSSLYALSLESILVDWEEISPEDRITGIDLHGDALILTHSSGDLSVLDAHTREIIGYAALPDGRWPTVPYGELYRSRYKITPAGRFLYVLDGDEVVKYRLSR